MPDAAVLDIVTGPAASGSPVLREDTGELVGMLTEGQINRSAAFSVAKLLYLDSDGRPIIGRAGALQVTWSPSATSE